MSGPGEKKQGGTKKQENWNGRKPGEQRPSRLWRDRALQWRCLLRLSPKEAAKLRAGVYKPLTAGTAIIALAAVIALAGAVSSVNSGFFAGAAPGGSPKAPNLRAFFSQAYAGLFETVSSFSLGETPGLKKCLQNLGLGSSRFRGSAAGLEHLQKKMQEHNFYIQSASLIVWGQATEPVTADSVAPGSEAAGSGAAGKDAAPGGADPAVSPEKASFLNRLVKKVEAVWLDPSAPVWPQGIWSTGSWDGAVEISYSRPLRPDLNFQAWERRFVFPGGVSSPAEELPASPEPLDAPVDSADSADSADSKDSKDSTDSTDSAREYSASSSGEEHSTVVLCLEWAIEEPDGQAPGISLEQAEATLKKALAEEGWPAKTVFEVRGCCPRLLGEEEARRVADDILLSLGAEGAEYFVQPPLLSVTARVAGQEDAVLVGGKKVSLQMAVRPHPEEGCTYLYAGMPMLLAEY